MKNKVTTKGFLSIGAAILFVMSLASITSALEVSRTGGILPVVIATDSLCITERGVDQAKVQAMVNAAVTEITGMPRMCDAWENIFPYNAIDSSTKILVKYNPRTPTTSREAVVNAVKEGLTYMNDYTFPEANIMIVGDEGAEAADTIVIDPDSANLKYAVLDKYIECDYIINLNSSWGSDLGCGVDMALATLMDAVVGIDGTTKEDMYPYLDQVIDTSDTSTLYPALSVLARHETFFQKQILFITDVVTFSATGDTADLQNGYSVYITTNLVVNDYQGVKFLKENGGLTDENAALGWKVCTLACVAPYDLGVVNEGQMFITNLVAPFSTSISVPNSISISPINLFVNTNPARSIFSYNNSGTPANIVIFNLQGQEIWSRRSSENTIIWNNNDHRGQKVPSGMYLYEMKMGDTRTQGKTAISR